MHKFLKLLDWNSNENCDDEKNLRMYFINTFSLFSLLFFLIFAVTEYINLNFIHASVLATGLLLIILNIIYVNRTGKCNYSGNFLIALMTIIMIYLQVSGGANGTGWMWSAVYPIIALFLLGLHKGSILSGAFFILMFSLFLLPFEIPGLQNIPTHTVFRILAVYISIYVLVYMYELINITSNNRKEKKMLDAINEVKRKDEFLSKLSHQLRTPLNNITVLGNLINKSNLTNEQKEQVDTLVASANNLANVVNNIVDISSEDISRQEGRSFNFDILETLENISRLFNDQIGTHLHIETHASNFTSAQVVGDSIKLKQIFLNLFENIIKATNNQGVTVHVSVNLIADKDRLSKWGFQMVIDQKILFQPYPHGESQDEYSHLDEQDMSIAQRLISGFQGKLSYENIQDKTLISFNLVFLKKDFKEEKLAPMISRKTAQPKLSQDKNIKLEDANVLLVEDNLINQKIVVLSLSKLVKNIDIANNGKEALDKFGTSRYDVILMDIQMPVMDGIVATRKMREIEESTNTHTPIIAITANALTGDKETCLAAGMNDYLAKPFQVEELLRKIENLLSVATREA